MLALSIRQPWAWLIANGFKDIENRTWPTRVRGPILIHAGATMTRADWDACDIFVSAIFEQLSDQQQICLDRAVGELSFESLRRQLGGIVGKATLTDCVTQSTSPWFTGDHGFVLQYPKPLPLTPYKGSLGFFNVPIDL